MHYCIEFLGTLSARREKGSMAILCGTNTCILMGCLKWRHGQELGKSTQLERRLRPRHQPPNRPIQHQRWSHCASAFQFDVDALIDASKQRLNFSSPALRPWSTRRMRSWRCYPPLRFFSTSSYGTGASTSLRIYPARSSRTSSMDM